MKENEEEKLNEEINDGEMVELSEEEENEVEGGVVKSFGFARVGQEGNQIISRMRIPFGKNGIDIENLKNTMCAFGDGPLLMNMITVRIGNNEYQNGTSKGGFSVKWDMSGFEIYKFDTIGEPSITSKGKIYDVTLKIFTNEKKIGVITKESFRLMYLK